MSNERHNVKTGHRCLGPVSGFSTISAHASTGSPSRDLASRWNRVGGLAFRHGEHFQNLKGLRHYKERFGGEWRTQYLAAPGGPALPRILADLAALLSGDAGRSSA